MSKKGSTLRLFVGVYPPPEVASALMAALAQIDLPSHRVTMAAQVHLTLQFIGDTPGSELQRIVVYPAEMAIRISGTPSPR